MQKTVFISIITKPSALPASTIYIRLVFLRPFFTVVQFVRVFNQPLYRCLQHNGDYVINWT